MSLLIELKSASNSLANCLFFGKEVEYQIKDIMTDLLGPHKAETSKVEMNTASGICSFQENLQISATIYYDTKEEKYVEKKV